MNEQFIYNVTIKVLPSIEQEWLDWMRNIHLDEVIATGMFDRYLFSELLDPIDEEGKTFVAQYFTTRESRYLQYIEVFAPALREKGYKLFGNQFIAFRTILKVII